MDAQANFDARLEPSEKALVQTAQSFAEAHLTGLDADLSGAHRALLQLACRAGLAGIEVPAKFGGASASFSTRMRVCEALARVHAGFAFSLVNHHNIVSRIAHSGTSAIQQALIPAMLDGALLGCTAMTEPQSGSDFTAMQTRAERDNYGWVLTGTKAWITNASLADVFLVYAQTDPARGADGVAGFIVLADDSGFQRGEAYAAAGTEGMGVGEFSLNACTVPLDRVLYPPGHGFRSAMRGVNQARIHVAAMNAAMIDTALSAALDYAGARQAFGKSIMEFQGISWSLAQVATNLQAMRLLAYAGADAIDAGQDAQAVAAMAKKFANDHAVAAISTCMQAMGAEGLTDGAGLARLLAWAKAFCYTDGTPEMMNERIARFLSKANRK